MGRNLLTLLLVVAALVLGGCSLTDQPIRPAAPVQPAAASDQPPVPSGTPVIMQGNGEQVPPSAPVLEGVIRTCQYTLGEAECGKCYCVEDSIKSCEIIDISEVGDLASFVGKKVSYGGIRDSRLIGSDKNCPRTVKIMQLQAVPQ